MPKEHKTSPKHSIQVLPPEVQNRIAAGEVVERPASALKELMENAFDAGADHISVSVDGGGRGLLEVRDNGWGLSPEDMALALTRHATSKIRDAAELFEIGSYGFRGEALPSIASVSHFSITSKTAEMDAATHLELLYGETVKEGPAALSQGTRIQVRDLFANQPARLKFLKTPATETKRCSEAFLRLALIKLNARMDLRLGGTSQYAFTPGQSLIQRLAKIWPAAVAEELLPLEGDMDGEYAVGGAIGSPKTAQGRGDRLLFFVNDRPVMDRLFLSAVREAYSGRLLSKEYPQAAIFLSMPRSEVDVNVHPAKTEVRFRDERAVFSSVRRAIRQALDAASESAVFDMAPRTRNNEPLGPVYGELPLSAPKPSPALGGSRPSPALDSPRPSPPRGPKFSGYEDYTRETRSSYPVTAASNAVAMPRVDYGAPAEAFASAPPEMDFGQEAPKALARPDAPIYLGRVDETYIVLALPGGGLGLLDQHAAHERILYNARRNAGRQGRERPLATSLTCVLTPGEAEMYQELKAEFQKMGYRFGETQRTESGIVLRVTAVPELPAVGKAMEFLREALAQRRDDLHELWALLSCKAAIKAGDPLTDAEAGQLVEHWAAQEDRDYCPHGRPALVTIGTSELEKLFKRRG
jgi:DNA mismatch repair protein MutL